MPKEEQSPIQKSIGYNMGFQSMGALDIYKWPAGLGNPYTELCEERLSHSQQHNDLRNSQTNSNSNANFNIQQDLRTSETKGNANFNIQQDLRTSETKGNANFNIQQHKVLTQSQPAYMSHSMATPMVGNNLDSSNNPDRQSNLSGSISYQNRPRPQANPLPTTLVQSQLSNYEDMKAMDTEFRGHGSYQPIASHQSSLYTGYGSSQPGRSTALPQANRQPASYMYNSTMSRQIPSHSNQTLFSSTIGTQAMANYGGGRITNPAGNVLVLVDLQEDYMQYGVLNAINSNKCVLHINELRKSGKFENII